jgi:hypothetical protein
MIKLTSLPSKLKVIFNCLILKNKSVFEIIIKWVFTLAFLYGLYYIINLERASFQYETIITIADKRVKQYYEINHMVDIIDGKHVLIPYSKLKINYYIEGTDKVIYKIPYAYFNRVKLNDNITVSVVAYKNKPLQYIRKLIKIN